MDENFKEKIIALHGENGKRWLENLPQLIAVYEKKWGITVGQPFGLSYNYVAPAILLVDGTPAVLKIGFPNDREFLSEIKALKIFEGKSAVRLLVADEVNAAILEQQIIPGKPLALIDDDEKATRIASDVVEKLWRDIPQQHNFILLEEWMKGFVKYRERFGKNGPIPLNWVLKGKELFGNLVQTTKKSRLLHGDFHHNNILFSEKDGWMVIDPKGVIGDPMYDLAVFLYNPIPTLMQKENVGKILKRRIEIFSEKFGFDSGRIIEWGIAQAVLSAIWSVEDGGDWEYTYKFGKILEKI